MSTRSVIAKPTEHGWVGRYCHSDGYPEHMVPELMRLVKEKGLDRCIDILINFNAGWSFITDNPTLTVGYNDDGRFKVVSNYGIAYTTRKMNIFGQADYQQASMDDWIDNLGDSCGAEWAYVLTPEGIKVFEDKYGSGWVLFDTVAYDSESYRARLFM